MNLWAYCLGSLYSWMILLELCVWRQQWRPMHWLSHSSPFPRSAACHRGCGPHPSGSLSAGRRREETRGCRTLVSTVLPHLSRFGQHLISGCIFPRAPAPCSGARCCSVLGSQIPGPQPLCLFAFCSSGLGAGSRFLLWLTSRLPQHPPRLACRLLHAPETPLTAPDWWMCQVVSVLLIKLMLIQSPRPTAWSYKLKQVIYLIMRCC